MTAEEAVRQADAEGLTLLKADNTAGYKGVTFDRHYPTKSGKSYKAKVTRGGKSVHLGTFATAEEAALCYARTARAAAAEARATAAAAAAPTAAEALRQAEAEGRAGAVALTLAVSRKRKADVINDHSEFE